MNQLSDEQWEQAMAMFTTMNVETAPDFFYTRLKARMENETMYPLAALPVRPILIVCTLTLFLFINSLLLEKDKTVAAANTTQSMAALAAAYDQSISN
jgi:hypothetical protein